jgi:putative FmdB family regulatory protein
MPFYEYECQACKFYAEVMQKISDAPLSKCPSCGKRRMKKLVSAPVFRLKGGGWYETDFKGDSENKRNLVGADKDEPKSEPKADTKAETKAEAKDAKAESKDSKEPKESKESKEPKESKESKEPKPAAAKSAAGTRRAPARSARTSTKTARVRKGRR